MNKISKILVLAVLAMSFWAFACQGTTGPKDKPRGDNVVGYSDADTDADTDADADIDTDADTDFCGEDCWVSLSVSQGTACVVDGLGAIECWGDRTSFIEDLPDQPLAMVDLGLDSACGLTDDGEIACWGDSYDRWFTEPPPSGLFTWLSCATYETCCATTTDGHISCWSTDPGLDGRSVPVGSRVDANTLTGCVYGAGVETACVEDPWNLPYGTDQVPSGARHFDLMTSGDSVCGLTETGQLECWGNLAYWTGSMTGTYVQLGLVASGAVCALRDDAEIECTDGIGWPLPPSGPWDFFTGDPWDGCGIRPDGDIDCWGSYQSLVNDAP